jgi:hypothetical protein
MSRLPTALGLREPDRIQQAQPTIAPHVVADVGRFERSGLVVCWVSDEQPAPELELRAPNERPRQPSYKPCSRVNNRTALAGGTAAPKHDRQVTSEIGTCGLSLAECSPKAPCARCSVEIYDGGSTPKD